MPNDFDKVIATLRYLELEPNIESYKWRFLIQKTTYLAQALGIPTHYYFTVYVAGPYSPALTVDYYNQREKLESLQTDYELTSSGIKHLERIKACCDIYENLELMEATSTVVYLMKENMKLADDDVFAKIKSLKPFLKDSTRVIAITKAKELLFEPGYLTDQLKREIEEWDRIES